MNDQVQQFLKMLAASAVTVVTTYQAVTAHIDTTVRQEVEASHMLLRRNMLDLQFQLDSSMTATHRAIRAQAEATEDIRAALHRQGIF